MNHSFIKAQTRLLTTDGEMSGIRIMCVHGSIEGLWPPLTFGNRAEVAVAQHNVAPQAGYDIQMSVFQDLANEGVFGEIRINDKVLHV
ncbi:MAG: hypothetical protein KatS3mg029_0608 [Saprospiraceae bacterium]|nr:MAG: hypothetical protein KatS3mg029_0608 [Saprospiraceae bacterium]